MKKVTVKQIQNLDNIAIGKYGISSIALMENAGRNVACEIIRLLKHKDTRSRALTVCIICGTGNNAGDGFVIARHLINNNIKAKIFLIGRAKKLKHDAALNYQILKKLKYSIKECQKLSNDEIKIIKNANCVVDAIFGVGLNREITEPFKEFIQAINKNAKRIIAVDIPSGLDGTTGKIYGVCIKANTTVTFSFAKKGFYKAQGPKVVGKVVVADIGIPRKLKNKLR